MNRTTLFFITVTIGMLADRACIAQAVDALPAKEMDYKDYAQQALAINQLHEQRLIDVSTMLNMLKDPDTVLIDVRSPKEYNEGHIKGALNISISDITEKSLPRIIPSKDNRIIIYCNNSINPYGLSRTISATHIAYPDIYELGYHNLYDLKPVFHDKASYNLIQFEPKSPFENQPSMRSNTMSPPPPPPPPEPPCPHSSSSNCLK